MEVDICMRNVASYFVELNGFLTKIDINHKYELYLEFEKNVNMDVCVNFVSENVVKMTNTLLDGRVCRHARGVVIHVRCTYYL